MKKIINLISKIKSDIFLRKMLKNATSNPADLKYIFSLVKEKFEKKAYFFLEKKFNKKKKSYKLNLNAEKLKTIPKISFSSKTNIPIEDILVNLAGAEIGFKEICFEMHYQDLESNFSLNRFYWMLEVLEQNSSKDIFDHLFKLIEDWIDKYPEPNSQDVFESYSISKRLVSWLFILMLSPETPETELLEKISDSVSKQLSYLLSNLELHNKYTNNHILVNAWCLIICGMIYNDDFIFKTGFELLETFEGKFFDHGVLLEGSSHYQMILTMHYLEILAVAELTSRKEVEAHVLSLLKRALPVCRMLQSKFESQEIPLFGDISPDVKSEWSIGYPFADVKSRAPWFKIFESVIKESLQNLILADVKKKCEFQNTWIKLQKNKLELWSIAKSSCASHGHSDNGSIVLFYGGTPVVIDSGRYDYTNDERSYSERSSLEHNFPSISGFYFDPPFDSIFSTIFQCSKFKLEGISEDSLIFTVESFDKQLEIKREILLESDKIIILDTVLKSGNLEFFPVEYRWCFAYDISFDAFENEFLINNESEKIFVKTEFPARNCRYKIVDSERVVSYGTSIEACKLIMKSNVSINSTIRTTFRFQEKVK